MGDLPELQQPQVQQPSVPPISLSFTFTLLFTLSMLHPQQNNDLATLWTKSNWHCKVS